MKKKILLAAVALLGIAVVVVVMAKPDWLASLGLGEESAVRKRADGYWTARLTGDLKDVAPYAHPLQKAIQENDALETKSFEILGVDVDGDVAKVAVKAKYKIKLGRAGAQEREVTHQDEWVRYDGQWYRAQHPVGFSEVLQHGLGRWKPATAPTTTGTSTTQ